MRAPSGRAHSRRVLAVPAVLAALAVTGVLGAARARADETPGARASIDRTAVRFWSPETGGASRPRFVTARELAFEARLEALGEDSNFGSAGPFQERHLRAATERHVAEELLATLMIEHGADPRDLPALTARARATLVDRVGGPPRLAAAMTAEGIEESELEQMLRRQVRAAIYIDRSIQSILRPTEEELREVFRTDAHPYKGQRLDDVRERFQLWLVGERLRQAESGFLQAARTRVKIVNVPAGG